MKKIVSAILAFALIFSVCSFSPALQAGAAAPEEADSLLSRDEIITQVKSCLFPAEGKDDPYTAIELLLPLVEDGDAEAQYYYAWIYDYALEENDETEKESLYWYQRSMEQGFLKAYLGVAFNDFVESDVKAKELAREAVSLGLLKMSDEELGTDGLYWIAHLYFNGLGVETSYRKGYEYLLKSAETGYSPAMNELAYYCFQEGHGVERSYSKALEWFTLAAEKGYPMAMTNIGYLYRNGLGVERNPELALQWFFKAAELGDPVAMNHIGDMYYNGEGIGYDYAKAMEWLSRSADAGLAASMHYKGAILVSRSATPESRQNDEAMNCYIDSYLNGYEDAVDSINFMLKEGAGVDAYFQRYGELIFSASR